MAQAAAVPFLTQFAALRDPRQAADDFVELTLRGSELAAHVSGVVCFAMLVTRVADTVRLRDVSINCGTGGPPMSSKPTRVTSSRDQTLPLPRCRVCWHRPS